MKIQKMCDTVSFLISYHIIIIALKNATDSLYRMFIVVSIQIGEPRSCKTKVI